jgi:2-polyprenyl-3-methyl-5-hydroxy-6-metoxy-1,4-benzoquinol methylase
MSNLDTQSEHLEKYRGQLLRTSGYEQQQQQRLKARVFDTFNQFLRFTGAKGLVTGMSLLDLGCADGSFVDCCLEKGLKALGTDINDGINLETDDLPFADDTFDVMTANSVLEHLQSPAKMLAEVHRTLKPGGALLLVTPNWKHCVKDFYDDPTHVRPYTVSSVSELLAMYGFKKVAVVPWLVKKPAWVWRLPWIFHIARFLPFRGDAADWLPGFLKGQSNIMMVCAAKSTSQAHFNVEEKTN